MRRAYGIQRSIIAPTALGPLVLFNGRLFTALTLILGWQEGHSARKKPHATHSPTVSVLKQLEKTTEGPTNAGSHWRIKGEGQSGHATYYGFRGLGPSP